MILNTEETLFLIIDIQEKLLNATFNKETLLKKAKILTKAAEILNIPTVYTEQYPQGLGKTIQELIINEQPVFTKTDFNALTTEEIISTIKTKTHIVVFGIETHICVYQTVVALLSKGFHVTVALDSCGSRSAEEHLNALNCLKDYGAKIKTTEMILFELLKTSKHPNFKELQTLIK